jgi:hypothetical protein
MVADQVFAGVGWVADADGGATADWVSMAKYRQMGILVIASGTGAGDVTLDVNQATDSSGTGAKALVIQNYSTLVDASDLALAYAHTSSHNSDAVAPASTDAGETLILIEVKAEDLDIANDFNHISITMAANVGRTTSVIYLGMGAVDEPAYAEAPNA